MDISGHHRSESIRPPASGTLPGQRTHTTCSTRVACSLKALGVVWLISGTTFCIIVKGPDAVSARCIWSSPFFAVGWLLVELPLVALGERVRRVPFLLLTLAGGLGGALIMALPTIVFGFYNSPPVHWKHSFDDLKWEGMAFAIAAVTTALYYRFLNHAPAANALPRAE